MRNKVNLPLFWKGVACLTMGAVLLGALTPQGICLCENCPCGQHDGGKSTVWMPIHSPKMDEKHCCKSPETPPQSRKPRCGSHCCRSHCCGLPEKPCPCPCCNAQKCDAILPKAVALIQKPNFNPMGTIISIVPAGSVDILRVSSCLASCRALPPPHVPLHVLLCVFLN